MLLHPPDALFVPAHVIPVIHPPSVVTIHDLGYLREPGSHRQRELLQLKLTTRWSTRVATKVIVPSTTTKRDVIDHLGLEPDKVQVIPHGVGTRFSTVAEHGDAETRRRLSLPARYVLTVGTIQPRKNLPLLARAVATINETVGPVHLVVVGKRGWKATEVLKDLDAAGLGDRLVLAGYVPDDLLPAVYRGAAAFCMPSRYEGFGLPVLEALASGVPSVVSDRGNLPDLIGEAGLIANADSETDMTRALAKVLENEPLRNQCIQTGLARAGRFSWHTAASETLGILRAVARSKRGRLRP
jgi:glycosyltransferase involved in cell wall biosynthesis